MGYLATEHATGGIEEIGKRAKRILGLNYRSVPTLGSAHDEYSGEYEGMSDDGRQSVAQASLE